MDLKSPFSLLNFNVVPVLLLSLLFLFFLLKFGGWKSTKNTVKKLPPGPWKLPVIGSLLHMVGPFPHRTLKDLARKHGPLMHMQLGQLSAIFVSSARVAKEVMKTHDLSLATRPKILAAEIVGYNCNGIGFAPYGDYWRQMRKICTSELLSAKKVRSFRSIREDEVWNLIESIRSSSGSLPIDLTEKIFSLTNGIVCRSTLGNRCKDQDSLIKIIKELISLAGDLDVTDMFPSFKFLHVICSMRPKLEKLRQFLDQIFDSIINERIEEKGNTTGGSIGDHTEDLLDVLIRLKDSGGLEFPITHTNIKAIILDLFIAGTDTSSTTIEWAMAETIRNPRVMEKAQADLRRALKGKKVIEESDIKELGYLKLVIKETLRLHPPVALLVPRECREECEIDGYTIPVGTKVMINAWAIGRDPEYWNDAESFYPERFENSDVDFLGNNYEYIPFGAGRRMCPGMNFGLANVELPLANLLYHFNWKLPNGMEPGDLDMSESFGGSVKKRSNLCLIATSPSNSYS